MIRWWIGKVRRTWRYLGAVRARISPAERAALVAWLTPQQQELFDRMHVADRRHGLDVVASLREAGFDDADVLLAGLLHDAAKGRRTRLVHRVTWSLGEAYGAWVWRMAAPLPTMRGGLERMRTHAERSAVLAEQAGCSPRTVELIRNQATPQDDAGRALAEADGAN